MQTLFKSLLNSLLLLNIIEIDPYNIELYRFKVGSFLRHSVVFESSLKNVQS